MDEKRGIGKNNQLLFKISEDLKRFKELTTGHPVIMGRKTYESIGRLLPNRTNIIITHNSSFIIQGALIAGSLEEGIELSKKSGGRKEIFIIGGGQIFAQAIGIADKLYLTLVNGEYDADTFFPDFSAFKVVKREDRESEGYKYKFLELTR